MSSRLFKFDARARITALGLLISGGLIGSAIAAPPDELAAAIAHGGASSAQEASPRQFLGAYASLLVRAKPKEVLWYVNAAVKVRPDLAPKIVVITLNVRRLNMKFAPKRELFQQIADIIQAAVMASPEAAPAIVKAAVAAAPFAVDCIVAAAIAAAPDQRIAFVQAASEVQFTELGQSNPNGSYAVIPSIGTINPADYARPENVTSPEQPPPVP